MQQAITKAQADVKIETFNADGTPHRAPPTPPTRRRRPRRAAPPAAQRRAPLAADPPPGRRRSPLAVDLPELPPIAGVRLGAAAAGIRYQGRTDLVMAELPARSTVAGVFTRSRCPGAPVDWCRAALPAGARGRWW